MPEAERIRYVLWDHERRMWWRPNRDSYTPNRDEAGRYSEGEALSICRNAALGGDLDHAVTMVAAQPDWPTPCDCHMYLDGETALHYRYCATQGRR